MPGIVAIVTRMPREQAEEQLLTMLEATEPGDRCSIGTWIDEGAGLYAGWVAPKGSFAEAMPLRNESGDLVVLFSGEEFPKPGTAEDLRRRGHSFNREGPSYLVHLCEEDNSFPSGLNGRFHGVVLNRRTGTVVVFNDRYGMHRLCWHEGKEGLYFAAEAKSILAVRPALRGFEPRSLGEFVSCGAVLENRTLFEGIQVLPPASRWVCRRGQIERKSSYFQPEDWENQETLEPEAYYRELSSVFSESLPRYFAGPQPIGMSLTGGLDTRMILACHRPEPGSVPCYTFGSMYRDNEDVRVARRVAAHCGQTYQVLIAGPEFLARFGNYAERTVRITEGCVDVGRSPDLYLNELAAQVAPLRMTGNYGGEILRGIRSFKPQRPAVGIFCREFVERDIHCAEKTYADVTKAHPVSFAAFRQGPWHLHGVLALEETQLTMRSPYLDNDLVRTVFRAPASCLSSDVSVRLIGDHDPRLAAIPTDRGLAGKRGRAGEFLTRSRLEFLFKAEYAYDMGMPQWLARIDGTVSGLRMERLFLGRHKPFHFRIWYRDTLAPYVRQTLLDDRSRLRPYLDARGVETAVGGHLSGRHNYTVEIHKLLTLELLQRLFLDGRGTGQITRRGAVQGILSRA
jgi:asparagine synthase (glutamine-hydrolysing)